MKDILITLAVLIAFVLVIGIIVLAFGVFLL